jgi:uncharacterized protein
VTGGWQLSLAGLLVGMLVGATGMGGGSLMTPMLVFVFGVDPRVAIGTDIFHGAIFKSVGAFRHQALGTVQARLSGWMLLGSAPTSLLGVATATWIQRRYGDGTESIQATALAVALVAGGIGTVAKAALRRAGRVSEPFVLRRRDRIAAVCIGVFGGFVVGLTSVGSGVFFGLTMLIVFPLRASKVVGTDIFHAAALLWVAGAGHLVAGNVDLATAGWLLLGSIPGVLLSSNLAVRVPDRRLRFALGAVLLLSGIELAPRAGLVTLGVATSLVCALMLAARLRAARRERTDAALAASPPLTREQQPHASGGPAASTIGTCPPPSGSAPAPGPTRR